MKRGARALVFLLSSVAVGWRATAAATGAASNPYQGIVERNVFDLRPPPPPGSLKPPAPPPPKVWLTGIITILGKKQALLRTVDPSKPPKPAKEEFYTLTEGQRDGDIEVLAIDVNGGTVKVDNHGTIQTLDFEDNGVKSPGTPGSMLAARANLINRTQTRFRSMPIPPRIPRLPPAGSGFQNRANYPVPAPAPPNGAALRHIYSKGRP